MIRWVSAFIALSIALLSPMQRAVGDDPVRVKLDKAKLSYEADAEKHKAAIAAWFDKREDAARDKGDKKAVDQVKIERQTFDEKGELPKTAPATLKSQLTAARFAMEAAYKTAIKEYTKAKQDDQAAAVEKELEAFKTSEVPSHPADAVKFGGKFYKVFDLVLSWHEAQARCEQLGGRLAVIDSAKENEFVLELVKKTKLPDVWLGATDEKKEGEWVWVTGKKMVYSNWIPGQPNNKAGGEHYLVLNALKGLWADQPDKSVQTKPGFVCQWD